MKLNVKSFALTCAIIWGLGLLLITWWIILYHFINDCPPVNVDAAGYEPPFIALIYWGYSFTPFGSLIGLVWAFFDALIGGAIFAWLYNLLVGKKAAA